MEDREWKNQERRTIRRRNGWPRVLLLSSILHPLSSLFCASVHAADQRQEEVFRSIQNSVRSGGDMNGGGMILLLLVGGIGLLVLLASLRKRAGGATVTGGGVYGGVTRPINHSGKLLREVRKQVGIGSAEMKQLKLLADALATPDEPAPSPLTLLLCPSVLAKAVEKARGSRIDRDVIAGLVKRIKVVHAEAQ
jgi:hypothetical protein